MEQQNADALFKIGMKHVYGDGVEQSYEKAIALVSQAAEQGHVEAIYNLAIFYHYGYGVKKDLEKAYGLYKRSADLGYAKGMHPAPPPCLCTKIPLPSPLPDSTAHPVSLSF